MASPIGLVASRRQPVRIGCERDRTCHFARRVLLNFPLRAQGVIAFSGRRLFLRYRPFRREGAGFFRPDLSPPPSPPNRSPPAESCQSPLTANRSRDTLVQLASLSELPGTIAFRCPGPRLPPATRLPSLSTSCRGYRSLSPETSSACPVQDPFRKRRRQVPP